MRAAISSNSDLGILFHIKSHTTTFISNTTMFITMNTEMKDCSSLSNCQKKTIVSITCKDEILIKCQVLVNL